MGPRSINPPRHDASPLPVLPPASPSLHQPSTSLPQLAAVKQTWPPLHSNFLYLGNFRLRQCYTFRGFAPRTPTRELKYIPKNCNPSCWRVFLRLKIGTNANKKHHKVRQPRGGGGLYSQPITQYSSNYKAFRNLVQLNTIQLVVKCQVGLAID